jgi:hypothetical protein
MKLFKKRSYSELLTKYTLLLTDESAFNEERKKLDLLTSIIQPEVEKAKELDMVDFTVDVTDVDTMEDDYLGIVMGELESPYIYCKYFKLKGRLYLTCAKEKSKAYKRLNHLENWMLLISALLALAISPLVHKFILLVFKDSYDPSVPSPFINEGAYISGSQLQIYVNTHGFVPAFTFFGSLLLAMGLVLLFTRYSKYSPYNKNVLRWSDVTKL